MSPPEAEMKLNQNVTQTNEKRDHVASLCSFVISEMGHGVPLVVVFILLCGVLQERGGQ